MKTLLEMISRSKNELLDFLYVKSHKITLTLGYSLQRALVLAEKAITIYYFLNL